MITQLRRSLKSKTAKNIVLWAIIAILVAVLGLGSIIPRLFKEDAKSGGIATVNGKPISALSVAIKADEYQRKIQFFKQYFGAEAIKYLKMMGIEGDPRKSAYETVIQQELLEQAADRMNIHLDSDFVATKMSDKDFLEREFSFINFEELFDEFGLLDQERLAIVLRMSRLTIPQFEFILREALKRDVLGAIVSGSSYIPEFVVKGKYMLDFLARKYSVLQFDFDSFLKKEKEKSVSKEELKRFYNQQNRLEKRYWVPEKRSGIAYMFNADSYGVSVDDDEIKKSYEDNKRKLYVKENAKIQARRILFAFEGKEDRDKLLEQARKVQADLVIDPSQFEKIAREMSDDKETAKNGGLLPFFSRGERNREFEKAAFLLQADGDVSAVVETDEGYEIAQRVKRKETEFKTLGEVKSEVRKNLRSRKFKRLFAGNMNNVLRSHEFNKNEFENLIAKASKKKAIELQVKKDDRMSKALFRIRDDVPAFYVDEDTGVVVVLKDLKKRHLPILDSIENTVRDDYYEKQASNMLDAFLKKATKEAKIKSLDELKTLYGNQYRIKMDQTGWVKQNDAEKTAVLREKGYPVEKMLKMTKTGFADDFRGGPQETSDGYLVKLDEIEKFNEQEYEQKMQEIKKGLVGERNMAQIQEFIAFLSRNATIKTNR